MMMWHYVPDGRWNGGAAVDMYTTHLKNALTNAWGGKRSFDVLEDNDPIGFKSGKGIRAKSAVGIMAFVIPKRSPELRVCDYAIWKEVNTRMRRQGLKRPKAKRESRNACLGLLRRTAFRLSADFINKSIGEMKRRCQRLYDAKGGFFEEIGH